MVYYRTEGKEITFITPSEIGKKLKAWRKDKTLTDEQWEEWATATLVQWIPATQKENMT